MRPVYQTLTAPNNTNPRLVVLDWMKAFPNVSVAIYVVSGSVTGGIQYTLDDLNSTSITPRWIDSATAPTGTTKVAGQAMFANFTSPITGVRPYITVCAGTIEFKVLQPPN